MRLTKRLSLMALLLVLAIVAAACGGNGGGTDNTDEPADTGDAKQGGSFVMSIAEPEHLTPTNTNETGGSQVLQTIFSGLIDYDPETSEPVNVMAEEITSEDDMTWTIKIKEGWTFHNGEPVTAQSFVDAWNYGAYVKNAQANNYFFGRIEGFADLCPETDPDTGLCAGKATAKEMSGLKAVDDTTIEVTLSEPFALYPVTLGYGAYFPYPKAFFDDPKGFEEQPIGNGPYQMAEPWKHNQYIKVERFEDYAGDPGNADAIEFRIYKDLDTAFRDLQGGNIDVVDSLPPEEIETAQTEFGDRYVTRPSSQLTYLGFPLYDDRFKDAKVRQAFSLALDRQAIIDAIFFGSLKAADSFGSPVVAGYREGVCTYCEFDPERAKELLEEAGGWEGPLELWFNNDGGHEEWMEAVKNQIVKNLGIEDVKFRSLPFAEYLPLLDNAKVTGPFRLGWVMDYPSIENYLTPIHSTRGSSNSTKYSNPEFDDLLKQGDAAGIEEGIPFYQQAEDILAEDMPIAPMWFGQIQTAHSERIDNVIVDALTFLKAAEVEVVEQ